MDITHYQKSNLTRLWFASDVWRCIILYIWLTFDLMPWWRWRISAVWQLHFRDVDQGSPTDSVMGETVSIRKRQTYCFTIFCYVVQASLFGLPLGRLPCMCPWSNMWGYLWLSIRNTTGGVSSPLRRCPCRVPGLSSCLCYACGPF